MLQTRPRVVEPLACVSTTDRCFIYDLLGKLIRL